MTYRIGEDRKPFVRELRKLGFGKLEFAFGGSLLAMEKRDGPRVVDVQLWNDETPPLLRACLTVDGRGSCTLPTTFRTVEGMREAVAYEFAREQDPSAPQRHFS